MAHSTCQSRRRPHGRPRLEADPRSKSTSPWTPGGHSRGSARSMSLKQVQVLFREVEDDVWLSRDTQDMHPHKGVEHPPRGGVLDACAFLVRKGGLIVLER